MAGEARGDPSVIEGRSVADLSATRQIAFWAFAALLVLAIVFYIWWGLSFGVWIDNGVYAVVATLAAFGLAGMWLVMPNPPPPALPPPTN
ncbi:MAG: hypothetical protein ABSA15_02875 [Thermoplasmata archaeon]|jgi:ABC-type dipeptide/oligopeptide/nickel transport system permease component